MLCLLLHMCVFSIYDQLNYMCVGFVVHCQVLPLTLRWATAASKATQSGSYGAIHSPLMYAAHKHSLPESHTHIAEDLPLTIYTACHTLLCACTRCVHDRVCCAGEGATHGNASACQLFGLVAQEVFRVGQRAHV
jgi:hypothetical protein